VTSAFVDYFRCPPSFSRFEVSSGVNSTTGFFRFGGGVCYGRSSAPPQEIVGPNLSDVLSDAAASTGIVHLPFDPDEVIDNIRLERYTGDHTDGIAFSLLRWMYYGLRPVLPVDIRKYLQRFHLSKRRTEMFPRWPIDDSVDRLQRTLMLLALDASGCDEIPFIWFWPCGYDACVIMTHDVEHEDGRAFCSELMNIDEAHGIPSSFQVVPEERYQVTPEFRRAVCERGFELNVHDVSHKCDLFREYNTFLLYAAKINEYAKAWGAEGFRAGAMYRKQEWLPKLQLQYDMSVPNVANLEPQPGGCCSLLPYFIEHLVELPLTMTQDYTLFHILNEYSTDLWSREIEFVVARHGLVSFIVHPDYVIEPRARRIYIELLEHLSALRERSRIWFAQPRAVAGWWRQRNALKIVQDGEEYKITGAGAEDARLVFASRGEHGLYFSDRRRRACPVAHTEVICSE
jgi:hypothetical protein